MVDGANPNAEDMEGWTALHYAAKYGRVGTCWLLLHCGADLLKPDRAGRRPREIAGRFKRFHLEAELGDLEREVGGLMALMAGGLAHPPRERRAFALGKIKHRLWRGAHLWSNTRTPYCMFGSPPPPLAHGSKEKELTNSLLLVPQNIKKIALLFVYFSGSQPPQ